MPAMDATLRAAHQDLIEQFWRTANAGDWKAFEALLSPEVVYLVPQTRERIRGREHFVEFFRSWPEAWRAELTRCIVDERGAVTVIDFLTARGCETGISFFELKDGQITEIRDFWPSEYEPPQRMIAAVERY